MSIRKGITCLQRLPDPALADRDADGVPDKSDECPNQKGEKRFQGCADTDGDGVPDNKDKCVNEKGAAFNEGCPIEQKIPEKSTINAPRTIVGKITDVKSGDALIGGSVSVVGTTRGTVSDIDGNFSVYVPEGASQLRFSYGRHYEEKIIQLGASNVVNVALKAKKKGLFGN